MFGAAMRVELKGKEKFDADVKAWFLQAKVVAAEAALGMAKEAFESIISNSPQYSGDFVSGWGVGYGKVVTNFQSGRFPAHAWGEYNPLKKGTAEPMEAARSAANWTTPKLGTTIYISNNAEHEGEEYAWAIENGSIQLRTENAGAFGMVKNASNHLKQTYKTISSAQLVALRGSKP